MSLEDTSKDSSPKPAPSNPSRKRVVSERRIEANRQNALRSTGPRTERGKRTLAHNAIKHGLLAREVVITDGGGEEPVGIVEESLVQTIATCLWRKARVIRAENGEIRKRLDMLAAEGALRNSDKANLNVALFRMELVSLRDHWSAMQVAQSDLRGNHYGLHYLSVLLKQAKSEIASDGYISEDTRKLIFDAYCFWDYRFAIACRDAGPPESKMEDRQPEEVVDEQTGKERAFVAGYIDHQLETISKFERYATERGNLAVDAEARSFSLPPVEATDKLLRYEAHLDRQLYRAMDQLERLQRQRRGEAVPPPLNINLGRGR